MISFAIYLTSVQQKHANGSPLERVVSAVEALHGVQIDEDVIIGKCTNAAGYLERATQEVEKDLSSGIKTSIASDVSICFIYQVTSHKRRLF